MDEYLVEIRKRFAQDKFATDAAGIVVEDAKPGYSRCVMEITEKHINAAGGVMGGAIFTLADFTFAIAVNGLEDCNTVSLASQITFLSSPKSKKLISESECIKSGRTTCFYTINIVDSIGTKVAVVTINGFKTNTHF